MHHLRRVRAFLGLRQSDIERAIGIPTWKLSKAEAGRANLTRSEEKLLADFLLARMQVVAEVERQVGGTENGKGVGQ